VITRDWYYRNLAALSEKGTGLLVFGTSGLEAGRATRFTRKRASELATKLNELISAQIESDLEWTLERALIAALMNMGAAVDGSWRNEIGEEGNRQVKALLASFLTELGAIGTVTLTDGTKPSLPLDAAATSNIRDINLLNGYHIRFSSEPDVAIRNADGRLVGTIEVKYGSDAAGALERYGAAKKSFDEAMREQANVVNIFLANIITDQVRHRIDSDRQVSRAFDFLRITFESQRREEFLRFLQRQVLDL